MTFASKSLLLAAVFTAVLSGVLWHRLDSTRHDNQTLRRELQTEQQARHTAEWLLHGQGTDDAGIFRYPCRKSCRTAGR